MPPSDSGRHGVYSATVANVNDPEQRGRVQLRIPSLFGADVHPAWAVPMGQTYGAGPEGTSGSLIVPELGAPVFVMFLDGSTDIPLWMPGAWPSGPREVGHDPQHPPLQHAYPTKRLLWRSRMGATLIETSQGDVTYANRRRDLSLKFEQGRLNINLRPGAKLIVNGADDSKKVARNLDPVKFGALSITTSGGSVTAVLWHPPDDSPPVTLSMFPTTITGIIDGGSPSVLIED